MRTDGVTALREERGFVELAGWRVVHVGGADAVPWLHDLLTADIAGATPDRVVRSLLLTPTGRIRADVWAIRDPAGVLLIQDPVQPDAIDTLLAPYVVSSDVELRDRSDAIGVLALPGAARLVEDAGVARARGDGFELAIADRADLPGLRERLERVGTVEADADALETWRIMEGRPRMGWDFDQESLPAEAGLEAAIDTTKGCFLGQESVARVRNLGHPRRSLRHVWIDGAVERGAPVLAEDGAVGEVTSVATEDGRSVCLARVRWVARTEALVLADGRPLMDLPHTD